MNNYKYNMIYFREWGSSEPYSEFPYQLNGVNGLPEHDRSQNDVDLDSFTNTKGKTVRNRVRHDVKSLDFNVSVMSGQELKDFFDLTKDVSFEIYYFDESAWSFVSKRMYRSGTVKYHPYYMDEFNPLLNVYENISFSLIEE